MIVLSNLTEAAATTVILTEALERSRTAFLVKRFYIQDRVISSWDAAAEKRIRLKLDRVLSREEQPSIREKFNDRWQSMTPYLTRHRLRQSEDGRLNPVQAAVIRQALLSRHNLPRSRTRVVIGWRRTRKYAQRSSSNTTLRDAVELVLVRAKYLTAMVKTRYVPEYLRWDVGSSAPELHGSGESTDFPPK